MNLFLFTSFRAPGFSGARRIFLERLDA